MRQKGGTIQSSLIRSLRRTALSLLNVFLNNRVFLRSLGLVNARTRVFASIFVAYPASAVYASYYFTPRMMEKARWSPVLCGISLQNSKFILGFGITSTESDFRGDDVHDDLTQLAARGAQLATMLRVPQVTFSGVLPGLMHRRGIVRNPVEAEVTAEVVRRSIHELEVIEELPPDVPIIVLGARGFVGSVLCKTLHDRDVWGVDIRDPWPSELEGQRVILVNVSHRNALRSHVDQLWPGVVLLNEVYPEPTQAERHRLEEAGIPVYHVVGVEAHTFPSMPRAYAGGIPCCAAWPADDLTPIVRRLGP